MRSVTSFLSLFTMILVICNSCKRANNLEIYSKEIWYIQNKAYECHTKKEPKVDIGEIETICTCKTDTLYYVRSY